MRSAFQSEQELGRLQHRFDDELCAVGKLSGAMGFFGEKRGVALHFGSGERPAEGALSELADEFHGTIGVGGGVWLAGEQMARVVTTLECGLGELERGGVVGFG